VLVVYISKKYMDFQRIIHRESQKDTYKGNPCLQKVTGLQAFYMIEHALL
jgi:hypothetical protein